jgi:hypothetical protein
MRLVAPPTISPSRRPTEDPAAPPGPRLRLPARTVLWERLGVPALLLVIVSLLYGDVVHYAFMYDDGLDLARGETRSVLSLLTSGEGAFYYRPLPFLVWKGLHALLGRYDLFWFHLPSLLLHVLNAYLVYRLARGLRLGPPTALIAALLFVVFPFNYQVVPWAGALFHPLVTALVLVSLLTYRAARLHGSSGWLTCSLLCAALALFTHEYAVTLGVLIAGVELWLWREGEVPAWRPYALLYFGLAGGYLLWWAAVPKWPRSYSIDGVSLGRNALMFLQAACWPLTLGWRWMPAGLSDHPELSVAALSALVLPLVTWLYWRAKALRWLVVAALWLAITALPVWATLSWEYLEDGARLYYLPGVGIALGWAALARALPAQGWRRRGAQALLVVVYAWAVGQSLDFLASRRAMYEEGTRLLQEAALASANAPAVATILYVNLPAWKAPVEPAFPLGNTGVTFVPEYVALGQAMHVNGGGAAALESMSTRELVGGWPSHYGPHGAWASRDEVIEAAESASAAYVARFLPDGAVLGSWPPDGGR